MNHPHHHHTTQPQFRTPPRNSSDSKPDDPASNSNINNRDSPSLVNMSDSNDGGMSSSSLPVTPSHVANQAWTHRQMRRQKRHRAKKQRRILVGIGAALVGLVLLVVHVEVSMLDQATTAAQASAEKLSLLHHLKRRNNNDNDKDSRVSEKQRRRAHEVEQEEPVANEEKDNNHHHHEFHKQAKVPPHKHYAATAHPLGHEHEPHLHLHQSPKVIHHDSKKLKNKHDHDNLTRHPVVVDHVPQGEKAAAPVQELLKEEPQSEGPKKTTELPQKESREEEIKVDTVEKAKEDVKVETVKPTEASKNDEPNGKAKKSPKGKDESKKGSDKPEEEVVVVENDKPKQDGKTEQVEQETDKPEAKKEAKKESDKSPKKGGKPEPVSDKVIQEEAKAKSDNSNDEVNKERDKPKVEANKDDKVNEQTKKQDSDKSKDKAPKGKDKPIKPDQPKDEGRKGNDIPKEEVKEEKTELIPKSDPKPLAAAKGTATERRAEQEIPTEENPELAKVVAAALRKASGKPTPKTANFCSGKPKVDSLHPVAPAVIIMGMEDTSTDLLWHVLSRIAPSHSISTDPANHPPQIIPEYEALNHMDPAVEENFWKQLKTTDHGRWVQASLCSQQASEHSDDKSNLLGFPWLTLTTTIDDNKATESLQSMMKWPLDTVKIIRYRRNLLDMISRIEQHLLEVKQRTDNVPQGVGSVKLDTKKILQQLTQWKRKEEKIDKFLVDSKIPHIVVDHETIFPFNDWKELVNVTSMVEAFPVPLNIRIDYGRVPPDQRPSEPSAMEKEWARLLEFSHISQPTALYDIFRAAETFDRKDKVFWTQQHSLGNYAAVQRELTGTHFQKLLRNLVYKHDYYGCACTDRDANKQKKLLNVFKGHQQENIR